MGNYPGLIALATSCVFRSQNCLQGGRTGSAPPLPEIRVPAIPLSIPECLQTDWGRAGGAAIIPSAAIVASTPSTGPVNPAGRRCRALRKPHGLLTVPSDGLRQR
jgi:hypothetical protein